LDNTPGFCEAADVSGLERGIAKLFGRIDPGKLHENYILNGADPAPVSPDT